VQLPEYWGKRLLERAGFSVPRGYLAVTADEAAAATRELGGEVVLKVQVAAGKRGKGGGVRFASDPEEARTHASELIGSTFAGLPVERLLIEERADIASELYAAVLNDARNKSPLVLLSASGGMDIESVSERHPERLARAAIDIRTGLDPGQARELVQCALAHLPDAEKPSQETREELAHVLLSLYAVYRNFDLELIEINPLAIERSGKLRALDCKAAIDDSAKRRHSELIAEIERDLGARGTERERRAQELGLLFIELGGDVALLANGAGLTMATMDAIVRHGGRPANFLEIGGDAYTKAKPALELVLSNPNVKSVVINFCGAFARTDVMTEGIVHACRSLRSEVPMFFCVHGTGEREAQELIRRELGQEPFDEMDDAVHAAVDAARAHLTAGQIA
jgi:succinyl-CoA synthetase beta subunit